MFEPLFKGGIETHHREDFMGTAKDYVTSVLADKLIPFMRRPVEDIIYETLDRRQTPSRKDFHELRDQINTLKGKLTNTAGGVGKLKEVIENLEDSVADNQSNPASSGSGVNQAQISELEAQIQALKATVAALNDKITHQNSVIEAQTEALNVRLTNQENKLENVSSQESVAKVKVIAGGAQQVCKVPGCKESVRARGFCRAHYAKWSRGTLDGFVNKEGKAEGVKLDKKFIGMAYELKDGQLLVNGEVAGSVKA